MGSWDSFICEIDDILSQIRDEILVTIVDWAESCGHELAYYYQPTPDALYHSWMLTTGWQVERLGPLYRMHPERRRDYLLARYLTPFVERITALDQPPESTIYLCEPEIHFCACALGADIRVQIPLWMPIDPGMPRYVMPQSHAKIA